MTLHSGRWPFACFLASVVLGRTLAAADLALFETPRDKDRPVLAAISSATKEVDVVIYEFTDREVEQALLNACRAGRRVRVIFNPRFASHKNVNQPFFDALHAAGADVHFSAPYFLYTHEKAIIVDPGQSDQKALIMTLNLSPGYLGKPTPIGMSLNFGVVDSAPGDVATIKSLFDADWADTPVGKKFLPAGTRLVVSPINSRAVLVAQIRQAKRSFHFFAQELFDPEVVDAAVAAARRGVKVRGLVPSNFELNLPSGDRIKAAGGDVRTLDKPVYQHAKAAIADGSTVYIGSINYSAHSFDDNRELGILTRQADIAAQMEAEFARFWAFGKAW